MSELVCRNGRTFRGQENGPFQLRIVACRSGIFKQSKISVSIEMINYDKHHFGGFKHQEWWTMSLQDTKKSEDLLQKHGCPRLGWVWFNNISSGRISSSLGWRIVRLDSQTAKMVLPLHQKNSHLPRLLKDWMTLSGHQWVDSIEHVG